MRKLRKFFALPSSDRWLLLQAAGLVLGVRVGLWVLPFERLQALVARLQQNPADTQAKNAPGNELVAVDEDALADEDVLADKVAWAVQATSKAVPRASCLTQALSTQILLARQGRASDVKIGVARNEGGKFEAHAWVTHQGRIIIGGRNDLERYQPLPPLKKRG